MEFDRKEHWEKIYQNNPLTKVGWHQPVPETSLSFINELQVSKDAKIIDVGGGDSLLVDHLIDLGYMDLTVLDISALALMRAQKRLGEQAKMVKWIESDATQFKEKETYDIWHDRAAFHFLTEESEINTYINIIRNAIKPKGHLIIGTFSENGPNKCSGISVKQYSIDSITNLLIPHFKKIRCLEVDHITPNNTIQEYVFCSFQKIAYS